MSGDNIKVMTDLFYKTDYISPLGKITIVSDGESIAGVWLEGQKYFCNTIDESMMEYKDIDILKSAEKWLDRYFAGDKPEIAELSLNPSGNEFRQSVWKILCEIPYGEVITYGDIAKKIAKLHGKERMSAQAVGGAVGHNPISIIIPCHRVVGSNGSLIGYAGGIETKIKLLEHEKVDMSHLFVPQHSTAQ